MEKEKEESKNLKKSSIEWADLLLDRGTYFVKNFGVSVGEKISEEIRKMVANIVQSVVTSLLLILGVVFVLIGTVVVLNELIYFSNAFGYFIVGFVVLFFALLIKALKKK